jgi:hypothetical protein
MYSYMYIVRAISIPVAALGGGAPPAALTSALCILLSNSVRRNCMSGVGCASPMLAAIVLAQKWQ